MQKRKIAFVVAIPLTAKAFLMNHFERLSEDFEVHLIANFSGDRDQSLFEDIDVRCHHVPIIRKISLLKDVKALCLLFVLFRREGFFSVHSVTPKAGLLTAIAARLVCVPHRIHIFTGQVWATRKGIMRFFLKVMDRIIAALDTNLLVDGYSQQDFLRKERILTGKESTVFGNGSISGVDLQKFNPSIEIREKERNTFGFSEDIVVFMYYGRLTHDKGIGELYTAFNRLVADAPNARLLFYGVDEEDYLKKVNEFTNITINKNFYFMGLTEKPFVTLQVADVFVLPTWREGFGISVLEASALEIPVITSNAYGVIDASIPNVTGLRCSVNDSDGLYLCMKKYYEQPNLRKEHGKNGRNRVVELFDSKIITDAWADYYHKMLGNDNKLRGNKLEPS